MSTTNPYDRNLQRAKSVFATGPSWRHSDYEYWQDCWRTLRDCAMGEQEIKKNGTRYLPQMEGMSQKEYAAYVDRATFYNMVSRTVNGLHGSLFRREPTIEGVPDRLKPALQRMGKGKENLFLLMRMAGFEIIQMGRYGVLLDRGQDGSEPYLTSYLAENIMDWTVVEREGRFVLGEVILREIEMARDPKTYHRQYYANYRRLRLDPDGVYRQYLYRSNGRTDADITKVPDEVIEPTNRGVPFDYIPFVFLAPTSNNPDVEKSPLLDIAHLNISHYKSYAHLEHGRFYTGMPIYYCQVEGGAERGSYTLGPSVVWEVGPNEKPGVIEFNGHGLTFLQDALAQKEAQVAALGGRLLGQGSGAAESDNALQMKDRNEQSLLLGIAYSLDDGFTQLVRWWAWWQDVPESELDAILVETNKEFLLDKASAREFRAIQAMYLDGLIPIEVVYDYLKRASVIPDWLTMDEFKSLLETTASFPMQPDAEARSEGYPGMQSKIDDENAAENLKAQQEAAKQQSALRAAQGATPSAPPRGGSAATKNAKSVRPKKPASGG